MTVSFNPYHEWLGVSADVRRPNHYELLGLRLLEDDREIIQSAVDRLSRRLRGLLPGEQGMLARRILGEIAAARDCLLDRKAKTAYDRQLGQGSSPPSSDVAIPSRATPSVATKPPTRSRQTAAPPPPAPKPAAPKEAVPPEVVELPTASEETNPPSRRSGQPVARPAPRTRAGRDTDLEPDLLVQDEVASTPRVPMVDKMALESVLEELAQAMKQCREVYLSCASRRSGLPRDALPQLARSQDRLHRCLLVKICATISEADGRWAYEEQRCAAALLRHVGIRSSEDELRKTVDYVGRQAARLDWQQLYQPFHEIPVLRNKIPDLETVVTRVANLIAKADGTVSKRETAVLQKMLDELHAGQRVAVEKPPQLRDEAMPMLGDEKGLGESDDKGGPRDSAALVQEALQRLDGLVGLAQVKQQIRELASLASMQNQRRLAGLPYDLRNFHLAFVGSPGTGKTAVAEVWSDVLAATGVLKHGGLVEVNPLDLASNHPKETAERIKARIAEAMGGALLVDHAGMLFSASEPSLSEAARVLLQTMGKQQGKLVEILADHSDSLPKALARRADLVSACPRHLQFPDFSVSQLGQVFQSFCDRNHYQVSRLAQIKLLLGFGWTAKQKASRFRNGHLVQQVFQRAVQRMALRLLGISPLTKELLTTFEDDDIAIEGVPGQVWKNLSDPRRRFVIHCPNCNGATLIPPNFLGIQVKCKRCRHQFVCAWGEPHGQTSA